MKLLIICFIISISFWFYNSNTTKILSYDELPKHMKSWRLSGGNPKDYTIKIDSISKNVSIISVTKKAKKWCIYMNYIDPSNYINEEITLKSLIKTDSVNVGFKLFLRADGYDGFASYGSKRSESFLQAEEGFKEVSLKMSIPEGTIRIAYGVILTSNGKVTIKQAMLNELKLLN